MSTVEKRFLFHANAVALAAHIRRREEFFVSAVASSGLPTTGGIGVAECEGKNYRDMISFDHASTSVFGDFTNPEKARAYTHGNYAENTLPAVTLTEAAISGLRVTVGGRTFHAERLQARMDNLSDTKGPARFHHLTSEFHRLSVDGVGLTVTQHCRVMERYDTRKKLCDAYTRDKNFRETHGRHFFTKEMQSECWFWRKPALPKSGPILGTIVTSIDWDDEPPKGVEITGNRITIKNFGSIHVGEILIEDNYRRVTLLRFQLGCPDGGECGVVDIASNGTRIPPRRDGDGDDGN